MQQRETLVQELKASHEKALAQAAEFHVKELEELQEIEKLVSELQEMEKLVSELQTHIEQVQVSTNPQICRQVWLITML